MEVTYRAPEVAAQQRTLLESVAVQSGKWVLDTAPAKQGLESMKAMGVGITEKVDKAPSKEKKNKNRK